MLLRLLLDDVLIVANQNVNKYWVYHYHIHSTQDAGCIITITMAVVEKHHDVGVVEGVLVMEEKF